MAIFNSNVSLPECNFAMMIPTGPTVCVFWGGLKPRKPRQLLCNLLAVRYFCRPDFRCLAPWQMGVFKRWGMFFVQTFCWYVSSVFARATYVSIPTANIFGLWAASMVPCLQWLPFADFWIARLTASAGSRPFKWVCFNCILTRSLSWASSSIWSFSLICSCNLDLPCEAGEAPDSCSVQTLDGILLTTPDLNSCLPLHPLRVAQKMSNPWWVTTTGIMARS